MRDERNTAKSELTQLKDELEAKDRHIDKLEGDNRKLENLKIDLENHINVVQEKLAKFENGGGDDRALTANIQKLINQWRRDSKQTRDWTKANQLISELEKIL